MAAVRAAAEAMGGNISVTSTPHVGTRIKFKLPSEHGKGTRSGRPSE
jgi:chemotaxis protein histidine kinase CheA